MVLKFWYVINKDFFIFFLFLTISEPILHPNFQTKHANYLKTRKDIDPNEQRNKGH